MEVFHQGVYELKLFLNFLCIFKKFFTKFHRTVYKIIEIVYNSSKNSFHFKYKLHKIVISTILKLLLYNIQSQHRVIHVRLVPSRVPFEILTIYAFDKKRQSIIKVKLF